MKKKRKCGKKKERIEVGEKDTEKAGKDILPLGAVS